MISIVKDLKESPALPQEWQGFKPGAWTESIDVRDFIQNNYTPYSGNEEFLSGPSQRTLRLWEELKVLLKRETDNGGVLDADEEVVSSIVSHKPGYIDKELEVVVGLQTDAPPETRPDALRRPAHGPAGPGILRVQDVRENGGYFQQDTQDA